MHNKSLDVTLERGLLGLPSLILTISKGFWRAIHGCALGLFSFGLDSLVCFKRYDRGGLADQTIETLGIDWLVFNILSFLNRERLAAVSSASIMQRARN